MRTDFFHRLPPPTAILLLASLLDSTADAHVALPPQPTVTVAHYALDVISWPLVLPTAAPLSPFDLTKRQAGNTICGYIGGLSALPATCSAGSHCVLDTAHQVIGCCPDGAATCTSGVFTACVDGNSGPQSEVNPYVFTCTGRQVCYKNLFEGGASQFGCGTAIDQATSVYTTANGLAGAITHSQISVPLTRTASRLSTPTTLGVVSSTSASTSRTSSTESSTSTTESSSSTESSISSTSTTIASSSTASTEPSKTPEAPPGKDSTKARTGAIVGGTLGGIAALALLGALVFWFLRRKRNANSRTGPGRPGINGKYISSPTPGPNSGFAAVSQDPDAYETGPAPGYLAAPPVAQTTPYNTSRDFSSDLNAGGPSPYAYTGAAGVAGAAAPMAEVASPGHVRQNSYPPAEGYHYPGQFPAAYAGGAASRKSKLEPDQVPLTREIDDFSQSFNQALGRIDEGGSSMETGRDSNIGGGAGSDAGGGSNTVGNGMSRPLWQQNRRQSRNLMWM